MAWFKKRPDPLSERSRALSQEIAALEAEIKKLDTKVQQNNAQPRLRSTAIPHVGTVERSVPGKAPAPAPAPAVHEPIFEEVRPGRLSAGPDRDAAAAHYNELGVRKYDLPALLRRWRDHWRGPSTTNPKLVNYLAAGGIQGLKPLRIEKRVARNRFLLSVAILLVTLLGLFLVFFRHR